ncbi:hypothetical protein XM38_009790 [Halomicronema hongdechloris C2206]|uniref:Uncharacterized protein n=1 Tax=Halomicronema hongdechloris C2206 TaxID=1641165 RepID=A0A1Z3HIA6_9CYAN|nr:hypothetical protein [Halomicronema hongdechloris]ASC70049.1 hypothetical protein XM38_009790 [Halomicronema hongdechloris C2206]
MRFILSVLCMCTLISAVAAPEVAHAQAVEAIPSTEDLQLRSTQVRYLERLDLLVFEQQVDGSIGATLPQPVGQLDGAPVLAYVFPTTLSPEDVGFSATDGTVALAVTSHPDFDDTPLWDENSDRNYDNDGRTWHTHWVVLVPDERVPGGLKVKEYVPETDSVVLPPTNPGMPMFLDSPGFSVVTQEDWLRVMIPAQRVSHNTDFTFDGVTAYMEVNTSDDSRPLLGVYAVYSIASGDLSLPFAVDK